ncbi:MAG: DNA topoisomerase VI subunit B [Planctomycetota bacterium]|nr:MAG: DNA topoisomerase VI subunit B [Planctomycetota bacterium]
MAEQRSLFAGDKAAGKAKADGGSKNSAAKPSKPRASAKKATSSKKSGAGKASKGTTKAHQMAEKAREISVSEFFAKNRHLLGFDSKRKALLTTVKEAVDNALDACEEADILPDLTVRLTALKEEDRYKVTVSDNGPGILPEQVDLVFAKLLYGSKFHRLRQSRGQQGIGISAAGMYGQMTTGKPVMIRSRIGKQHDAIEVGVRIDTTKNEPVRTRNKVIEWDRDHGTEVSITLEGSYKRGRGSVDEYIAQTAVANPHVSIVFFPPDKKEPEIHERATKALPRPPKEIKPHPYGVELGTLMKMMKITASTRLSSFLQADFSRVSSRTAQEICERAKLDPASRVKSLEHKSAEALAKGIAATKIMNPPTDCLSPIGEDLVETGLKKEIGEAEFFVSRTRPPSVYRGNPFQIEVGVALGGSLPADASVRLMRLANRVPLQYQPGACAITKAVTSVDWKAYGLQQPRGALPIGPVIIMVHIASAWVPFTSESKEAVASYPEILKELRLALQECGRKMQRYLRRRRRIADELKKRQYIDKYIPHIGEALRDILELNVKESDRVVAELRDTLERSRKL